MFSGEKEEDMMKTRAEELEEESSFKDAIKVFLLTCT